jgi:hypothetical protein
MTLHTGGYVAAGAFASAVRIGVVALLLLFGVVLVPWCFAVMWRSYS